MSFVDDVKNKAASIRARASGYNSSLQNSSLYKSAKDAWQNGGGVYSGGGGRLGGARGGWSGYANAPTQRVGMIQDLFDSNGLRSGYSQLRGVAAPRQGMLRGIHQAFAENIGYSKGGWAVSKGKDALMPNVQRQAYGGGLFTRGGLREITHELGPQSKKGFHYIGARRSIKGMAFTGAMKALGPGIFAVDAYQNGLVSAIGTQVQFAVGKHILTQMAPRLMAGAAPVAVAAAGLYGSFKAIQAGREYKHELRRMSFGNAASDVYGTAATMRQASLQAIQGSKVNGRSALGFEANLLHQ